MVVLRVAHFHGSVLEQNFPPWDAQRLPGTKFVRERSERWDAASQRAETEGRPPSIQPPFNSLLRFNNNNVRGILAPNLRLDANQTPHIIMISFTHLDLIVIAIINHE